MKARKFSFVCFSNSGSAFEASVVRMNLTALSAQSGKALVTLSCSAAQFEETVTSLPFGNRTTKFGESFVTFDGATGNCVNMRSQTPPASHPANNPNVGSNDWPRCSNFATQPPTCDCLSKSATSTPRAAKSAATVKPPMPPPTTMTSHFIKAVSERLAEALGRHQGAEFGRGSEQTGRQ